MGSAPSMHRRKLVVDTGDLEHTRTFQVALGPTQLSLQAGPPADVLVEVDGRAHRFRFDLRGKKTGFNADLGHTLGELPAGREFRVTVRMDAPLEYPTVYRLAFVEPAQ